MSTEQTALTAPDSEQRQNLHKMLSEMLITVSDQMFQNRDIYVDGYRFINCSFINCRLFAYRGTFEFHHCLMKGGVRIWAEDAMKCVQFYTLLKPEWQANPEFGAKLHPDGTFSIGKGVTVP